MNSSDLHFLYWKKKRESFEDKPVLLKEGVSSTRISLLTV